MKNDWKGLEKEVVAVLQSDTILGSENRTSDKSFSSYSKFHFILDFLSEVAKRHPDKDWLRTFLASKFKNENLPKGLEYFFPENNTEETLCFPKFHSIGWNLLGIKISDPRLADEEIDFLKLAENYFLFENKKNLSDWIKSPKLGFILIHLAKGIDASRIIKNDIGENNGVCVTVKILFTKEFLISLYTENLMNKFKGKLEEKSYYLLDYKIVQDVEDIILLAKQLNLIQDDRETGHFYLTPFFSRLMQKWPDLSNDDKNYELAKALAFSLRLPRGKIAQYGIRNLRIFATILSFFLREDPNDISWINKKSDSILTKCFVVLPTDKGGKRWLPYKILIKQGLSDEYADSSDPNETFALAFHACVTYGWLSFSNSLKISSKFLLSKKRTSFRRGWALNEDGIKALRSLEAIEKLYLKKSNKYSFERMIEDLYGYKKGDSIILKASVSDDPSSVWASYNSLKPLNDEEKKYFNSKIYDIFLTKISIIDEPVFSSFRNDPSLRDVWIRPGFSILKGLEAFGTLTFIEISFLSQIKSERKIEFGIETLKKIKSDPSFINKLEELIKSIHLEDYFEQSQKYQRISAGFNGSLASSYWFPLIQYTDHLIHFGLIKRNSNPSFKLVEHSITSFGLKMIRERLFIDKSGKFSGKIPPYPSSIIKNSYNIFDLINSLSSQPKTHLEYKHSVEAIVNNLKYDKNLPDVVGNQLKNTHWSYIAHQLYSRIKDTKIAIESSRVFLIFLKETLKWSWDDIPKKLNATHFEIYNMGWILDVLGNHAKAARSAFPDKFNKVKFQFPGKWSRLGLSLQKVLHHSFILLKFSHIYDEAYKPCVDSNMHSKKCRPDFIFKTWINGQIEDNSLWGDAKWQTRTFVMSDSARYLDHCKELLIFHMKGEHITGLSNRIKFVNAKVIKTFLEKRCKDHPEKKMIFDAFDTLEKDEIPNNERYQISKGEQSKLEEDVDISIEKIQPLINYEGFLLNF